MIRSVAHRLAGDRPDLPVEGRLPSFDGATGWLNSEPLTPEDLRGRVALVDFWTYTCVNWLRTLPYIRAWVEKYADQGLTVIGVHTPEFGFEHDVDNVTAQARDLRVEYPIALDNDYGVWTAFANHFWPAVYLADAEGRIRYHHFGEGEYAMTEMVIQQLLMDAGADGIDQDLVSVDPRGLEVAADWQTLRSSETYVGYGQSVGFASSDVAAFDEPHGYELPPLQVNQWGLSGIVDGCPPCRAVARRWRADCVPLPRARSESRDGPGGARRIGPVPCPARWHAAGRGRGGRREPRRQRHPSRPADLSADPAIRTDC